MNIVTENNQALKSIFHLDLDAFFCAVEVLIKPELEGKPFVVGGKSNRGVVTSASYAARRFGVRSAMPMARATQLCPGLIVVSSTRNEYGKRSKQVMEILNGFSDHVEQMSIDEAYIEVNKNSSDSILKKAKDLQSEILNKTGLPCSIG
ncbi:MAG: DNA polymerase IV, partial [Chloroflexi bacterium]|nr:DNA polymerase IV [Chloroflexota bacterium]